MNTSAFKKYMLEWEWTCDGVTHSERVTVTDSEQMPVAELEEFGLGRTILTRGAERALVRLREICLAIQRHGSLDKTRMRRLYRLPQSVMPNYQYLHPMLLWWEQIPVCDFDENGQPQPIDVPPVQASA